MALIDRDLGIALLLAPLIYGVAFIYGFAHPALAFLGKEPPALAPWKIFAHNVLTLAPLWLGLFSYGAVTVLRLPLQELMHGSLVGLTPSNALPALAMLFPHGFFEIPTIWIAAAAGLTPGIALMQNRSYPLAKLARLFSARRVLLALAALLEGGGR